MSGKIKIILIRRSPHFVIFGTKWLYWNAGIMNSRDSFYYKTPKWVQKISWNSGNYEFWNHEMRESPVVQILTGHYTNIFISILYCLFGGWLHFFTCIWPLEEKQFWNGKLDKIYFDQPRTSKQFWSTWSIQR